MCTNYSILSTQSATKQLYAVANSGRRVYAAAAAAVTTTNYPGNENENMRYGCCCFCWLTATLRALCVVCGNVCCSILGFQRCAPRVGPYAVYMRRTVKRSRARHSNIATEHIIAHSLLDLIFCSVCGGRDGFSDVAMLCVLLLLLMLLRYCCRCGCL